MKYLMGLTIALILTAQGCASFGVTKYNDIVYPPTNPVNVKVFQFMPPDKDDYIIIAELHGSGAPVSSRENMVERLKEKAAEAGGDAIVLNYQERLKGFSSNGNVDYFGNYHSNSNPQYAPEMSGVVLKRKENK